MRNLFINPLQEESVFYCASIKNETNLLGTKVSIFQQDQIKDHYKLFQRYYLAQTLAKTQNHI